MKLSTIPWSEVDLRVKQAASNTVKPGYFIPRKWFEERVCDFDLWLICGGEVEVTFADGRKSMLSRGAVVWQGPGDLIELKARHIAPYTNIYVHFDFLAGDGSVIAPERIERPPVVTYTQNIHYFESAMRYIAYLYYLRKKGHAGMREMIDRQQKALLKSLLCDYCLSHATEEERSHSGVDRHHEELVSSALAWLHLHPESTFSVSELAQKHGYSTRHFCRIFRAVTGKTPLQAQIEARIDNARKLLTESSLSVGEIAHRLGYENIFYFSRQFKQIVSLSPAEYRAMNPGDAAFRPDIVNL